MQRRTKGTGSAPKWSEDRNRWESQIDLGGVNPKTGGRNRKKVVGDTREEVEAKIRALIAERDDHRVKGDGNYPVADLYERWMKTSVEPQRKKNDYGRKSRIDMYRSLATNHLLVEPIGKMNVATVTPDDVEAWLKTRTDTLSQSSLKKLHSMLGQCFDYAVARRHVTYNPARAIKTPTAWKEPREAHSLTKDETCRLLDVAEDFPLGAFVVLNIATGARTGELCALAWDDVDLEERVVSITATKTGGKVRRLRISPAATEALEIHRLEQEDLWGERECVFINRDGRQFTRHNARYLIGQIADEAGIAGVNPYRLRHTAASLLAAEEPNQEALRHQMGHADISTTSKHYIHPTEPIIETAADFDPRKS